MASQTISTMAPSSAGGSGGGSQNFGKMFAAAGQLYQGIEANRIAKATAKLMDQQGLLMEDDYRRQAARVKEEGYRLKQQQAMDYISAGVEIQGTPLLVMAETTKMSNLEASWLESTGRNYRELYEKNADIKREEGRAAMISSIFNATATILG